MRGKVRRVRMRKEARQHNTDTLSKRRMISKHDDNAIEIHEARS